MAFEFLSGPCHYQTKAWAASKTITKGGCVRFNSSGYIEPATVASNVMYGVNVAGDATSSSTAGATSTEIIPFESGQQWKVSSAGDMSQAYIGKIVSLENSYTIDEDDTGNTPLFEVVGIFGPVTDKFAIVTPRIELFSGSGLE